MDAMERLNDNEAKGLEFCPYPKCEWCTNYKDNYCTVPIVINKQYFLALTDKIASMENDIKELDKTLYDEILGVKRGAPIEVYEHVDCAVGLPDDYGVE